MMELVGERLRFLREKAHLSQAKLAELLGTHQSAVNRYEHGQSAVPFSLLRNYADYFDVSLDYIFGRTDHPQGKLYEYKPNFSNSPEMQKFVEMCFEPGSAMNEKLKQAGQFNVGWKEINALRMVDNTLSWRHWLVRDDTAQDFRQCIFHLVQALIAETGGK